MMDIGAWITISVALLGISGSVISYFLTKGNQRERRDPNSQDRLGDLKTDVALLQKSEETMTKDLEDLKDMIRKQNDDRRVEMKAIYEKLESLNIAVSNLAHEMRPHAG